MAVGDGRDRGRLYAGTSGFAYPAWAPTFYPAAARGDALLSHYARRLTACELNNTFYQHPTEPRIARWLDLTGDSFRFTVKAQRGGSIRAITGRAAETVPWLTAPYRLFGDRLGSVLYRVAGDLERDDGQLRGLLAHWPRDVPLTMEFQHPSWLDDAVLDILRGSGVTWCSTESPEDGSPPRLVKTGAFLYLRLRRDTYTASELDAWAGRIAPFLDDGVDVFAFFRHDETGESPLRAAALAERLSGHAA